MFALTSRLTVCPRLIRKEPLGLGLFFICILLQFIFFHKTFPIIGKDTDNDYLVSVEEEEESIQPILGDIASIDQTRVSMEKKPLEDAFQVKRQPPANLVKKENESSSRMNRKLEFVHITKTGGSAIERAAADGGILWGACHHRQSEEMGCNMPDRPYFLNLTNRTFSSASTWHIPPRYYVNDPNKGADTFTVVRNPYDRAVSEYYCKWTGFKGNENQRNDAETMNRWILNALSRKREGAKAVSFLPMSIYVYDETGAQVIDHVLKFEHLMEEFSTLMERYGLEHHVQLRDKETNPINAPVIARKELSRFDLSNLTIHALNRLSANDFENFGYRMVHSTNEMAA